MAEVALTLQPGVNAEFTPALNQSSISSCNLIRFKAGLPEKLGGWTHLNQFPIPGIIRSLHAWQDLGGTDRLAIGSTVELAAYTSGNPVQITPQTLTSDFAENFSTTSTSTTITVVDPNINNISTDDAVFFNTPIAIGGLVLQGIYQIGIILSATSYSFIAGSAATSSIANAGAVPSFTTSLNSSSVTVTIAAHGLSVGDTFTFPIATSVGGLTISGTYRVASVLTSSTFTIAGISTATSGATVSMNSGNAELLYYLNLGPAAPGVGYGSGGYGAGAYGSGIVPPYQVGSPISATDWTIDNWGEILLSCPANGPVYAWGPQSGFSTAGIVATAPIFNSGIFVAMPEQILVCYGSTEAPPGSYGGTLNPQEQDPLIVRWSDSLDYTNFQVNATTQAGSFRIPTGSTIRGGIQAPQVALIWTDIDLYAMSYIGYPLVFGFNQLSSGCGLIGKHASAVMRGAVYWMSSGNFFVYSGNGVQVIPCAVWDVVFQNLDTVNQSKCVAAPNSTFDEMWFFYPSLSGGTGECDSYVKINIDLNTWDYGSLPRSAWIDQSVFGQPIGASSGILYQHETSYDADGAPLAASFTTGWFVIAEGQQFAFVDWFFPDMKWEFFNSNAGSASVQVTIETAEYPNQSTQIFGPYTMNQTTQYINTRLRGRLIRLTFSSSDLGTWWRLGKMRYRIAPDGRR